MDIAGFRFELLLKKDRQIDLADETDALRILAFGRARPCSSAMRRTSGLSSPPTGNNARLSCSCESWQRK